MYELAPYLEMSDLLAEDGPVVKTEELKNLMRLRFGAPEWALFFEVYATTGYAAGGRGDAVAMNLYPSRGLAVHGFELKISRADWLRELKNASKAETLFGYCNHWWLVVGDRSIVKKDELPPTWGLIAPRGDGLAIVVQAPTLTPAPLDRNFIAVLARRANVSATEAVDARVAAETKLIRDTFNKRMEAHTKEWREDRDELRANVRAFQEASGVNIEHGWQNQGKIGEAVKFVLNGGLKSYSTTLGRTVERMVEITEELRAVQAMTDGCEPQPHRSVE